MGMDFVFDVKFEPSVLLGIEETFMSWQGRVVIVLCIVVAFGISVAVSLEKMLLSTQDVVSSSF
jgi:hypothetical protein